MGLAARYLSASEEAQIGGDFYDALEAPWGLRLVVGDVRGQGLDAVRLASALLGEFRSRANSEPELTAVVKTVDAAGARARGDADEDARASTGTRLTSWSPSWRVDDLPSL